MRLDPVDWYRDRKSERDVRLEKIRGDVGRSMDNEGPVNDDIFPRKDGTGLFPPLKAGGSNVPDTSWSHLLEKAAAPLCVTDSNIIAIKGSNINTCLLRKCENDTINNTICSGNPFPGMRDAPYQNKFSYISSADACLAKLSKEQTDGEHDLLSYDCPNVGDFEDFERMFSSPGFHDVSANVLPAIDSSISGNQMPLNAHCNSFTLGSVAERKGKSVLSEMAHDDVWGAEKNSTLEQLCYGNQCRDHDMINTTLKGLNTYQGKEINPNLEFIAYSSSGGCSFIQDLQDQELLSSILSAPQPCSLHATSKQNLCSDYFASNVINSFSFQEQLGDILAFQQVPSVESTLCKAGIESSALPHYGTSINPSVQNSQLTGMLSDPFSAQPTMSFEKDKIIYASQLFPAAVDKHLEQHNAASDSLGQGKNNFQDDDGQNRELTFTHLNPPTISILSSTSHGKSCTYPSTSDDAFLKATSFQQFQMIMEQKGIRTKLCIRDSLYRLARSAEQRHYDGTADDVSTNSKLMHQGAHELNRHPEFIGMSNVLNAIDRSVAYLLFNNALGSGTGSADDATRLLPSMHIHGSGGKFPQI